MSDKDRQKKDGRDKNKKNQVMREANQNKTEKQARSQSNSTGQQSGGRK